MRAGVRVYSRALVCAGATADARDAAAAEADACPRDRPTSAIE